MKNNKPNYLGYTLETSFSEAVVKVYPHKVDIEGAFDLNKDAVYKLLRILNEAIDNWED